MISQAETNLGIHETTFGIEQETFGRGEEMFGIEQEMFGRGEEMFAKSEHINLPIIRLETSKTPSYRGLKPCEWCVE